MIWTAMWLALATGTLGVEIAAMVKNRKGTLSATVERRLKSHSNKAVATGAMFGFVAWFVVHLGIV